MWKPLGERCLALTVKNGYSSHIVAILGGGGGIDERKKRRRRKYVCAIIENERGRDPLAL